MTISISITILCIVFNVLSLLGLSSGSLLENFSWSHLKLYERDTLIYELYIGLNGYLRNYYNESGKKAVFTDWSGVDCNKLEDVCANCKSVSSGITTMAVMALITTIPKISNSLKRGSRFTDSNCDKFIACIIGLFGIISNMSSLINFSNNCTLKNPVITLGIS